MNPTTKHRVIIVDPSVVVFEGLRQIIESIPEISVERWFADYETLSDHPWQRRPDIIILNPSVISSHRRFHVHTLLKEFSNARFIALIGGYINPEIVREFDAVIDIFESREQIVNRLRSVANMPDTTGRATKGNDNDAPGEIAELSDREIEILVSVAQGLTNKEIAERHNISVHTVISHRKNISRKTGIRTVSGLTVYAMLNNLLP